MSQSNFVWLEDCAVTVVTENAIRADYEGTMYWLPRSQLADDADYKVGGAYTIGVTEWLANEKGIEV